MNTYHLTYFYLATGMEGIPDTEDLGYWKADYPGQAKDNYLSVRYPGADDRERDFIRGCLSATEVSDAVDLSGRPIR